MDWQVSSDDWRVMKCDLAKKEAKRLERMKDRLDVLPEEMQQTMPSWE